MLEKIVFILNYLLFSLSLFSLGLFQGLKWGMNISGIGFTIGNFGVYGPGPYEEVIFFQIIIFFFLLVALLSLFIENIYLNKILRLSSLIIVGLFYIFSYMDKSRYVSITEPYFDPIRETLILDKIGLSLVIMWIILDIYSIVRLKRKPGYFLMNNIH